MELVSVFAAATAAWLFGAVWYGLIGKQWMQASGLTEDSINRAGSVPYIVSGVCALVVAGMTRHVMAAGGIETAGAGLVTGLGLGAFVAAPWIVTNVMFGQRDRRLIWMDGVYPVAGMGLMGLVLALL